MLPTISAPVLAYVVEIGLVVLERRLPGFVEELRLELENEAMLSQIARLRGLKLSPETRHTAESASTWLNALALIVEPSAAEPKRRRWWQR